MARGRGKRIWLNVLVAALLTAQLGASEFRPRLIFGGLFEPQQKVIHGAGQSAEIEFANYVQVVGPTRHPAMYSVSTQADLSAEVHQARAQRWKDMLRWYPDGMALYVGLSMAGHAQALADGRHDAALEALADSLNGLNRPVFVQIGYAVEGSTAGEPAAYVSAFRRVAEILRERSDRIAIVWGVSPAIADRLPEFYPGHGSYSNSAPSDAVADWWAFAVFNAGEIDPSQASFRFTRDFLRQAERARKPVMIAPSAPKGLDTAAGEQSWDAWYRHFFALLREFPAIKGFVYINRNWRLYDRRGWRDGGDSRLEKSELISERWRDELARPWILHADTRNSLPVHVLTPTDDAYIQRGEHGGLAFGRTDPERLLLSGNRRVFIKFDISDLFMARNASLWLFGNIDSPEPEQVRVFAVRDDVWYETSLTWNQQPSVPAPLRWLDIINRDEPGWNHVGITDYIRWKVYHGQEAVSLVLAFPLEEERVAGFRAKEDGQAPPQLIIHGRKH